MKKQALLLLLIIIISPTVFAQTIQKIWSKKYLDTNNASSYFYPNRSIADKEGNLLVTADNLTELEILKFDTAGNMLWKYKHRHYTTLYRPMKLCQLDHQFEHNYITLDDNNNIYVSYSTDDSATVNTRWCIMKISPSGTLVWDKMYEGIYSDGAYPVALQLDASGNIYAIGIGSEATDDNAMVLIKLNSSGVLQWEKLIDGNAIDNGNTTSVGIDLVLDNNANIYVTGHLANYDSSHHFDLLLAKYSSAGNLLWKKEINFGPEYARDQQGRRVILQNNELIVCGYGADSASAVQTVMLMKFDLSGNEIWRSLFVKDFMGYIYGSDFRDIKIDNAGDIVMAIRTGNFGSVGLVVKFSGATGDTLWTYQKDYYSNWQPTCINIGSDNLIYAWGDEDYYYGGIPGRTWLIVLDPSGNLVTSIVDTTVTYEFNYMEARSIVRIHNSLYGFAFFGDDIPPTMNGLMVKFSAPDGNTTTTVIDVNPSELNVFPNPFSNHFRISPAGANDNSSTIRIYNAEGKEMLHDIITGNTLQVDATAWQAGIYFAKVLSEKQTQTFKLIKN